MHTEEHKTPLPLSRVDALPLLLALGILGYGLMSEEPSLWALLGIPVWGGIALLHRHQPSMRDGALAVVVMLVGLMAATWQTARMDTPRIPDRWKPWQVTGRVVTASPDEGKAKLLVAVERIKDLPQKDQPRYVRVSVRGKEALPRAGDRVDFRAILYAPSPPLIPGGFDFARYFYFRGVGAVGYALPPLRTLEHAPQPGLLERFSRMRFAVQQWLLAHIPQPAAGVAVALLTGDSTAMEEKTNNAFRVSSLAHILSISGTHMAIVCGMMFLLLRSLLSLVPPVAHRMNVKKIAAVVALLLGAFYLALADFPIPAVRAYMMVAFFFAGVLLDREALTLRALVWAAVVILLLEPSSLLEPGFQMSFAATVALIVAYRNFAASPLGNRWEDRRWWQRVWVYFSGIVVSSLVASAATAPFAAYHFNQFVLYGVLANLLALPLLSFIIMPALLLALVLWPLGFAAPALLVAGWGTQWMIDVAVWVEGIPGAAWYIPPMRPDMFALVVAGMLLILFARKRWKYIGLALSVAGMLSSLLYVPPDILVADDGRELAVRLSSTRSALHTTARVGGEEWVLVRGKSNRNFAVEMWQQRLGVTMQTYADWQKTHAGSQDLVCDAAECRWQQFIFPMRGRILARWKDGEIRWPDLDARGAHAVWLEGDTVQVVTGCDSGTTRPWSGCY